VLRDRDQIDISAGCESLNLLFRVAECCFLSEREMLLSSLVTATS